MTKHLSLLFLSAFLCITWVNALRPAGPCDITKCKSICKYQCPYGREKDVFGCCLRCMKGPGETCRGSFNLGGNCGGDLVCIGSDLRRRPGICLPKVKCINTAKCVPSLCKHPKGCTVGIGRNACSCCPGCLRDEGEPCGLRKFGRVPCGKGLECCGETSKHEGHCKKISLKKNFSVCYKVKFCPYSKCVKPTGCGNNGVGMSPCGCCSGCLNGMGQKCGVKHYKYLPCASGLICKGECTTNGYRPGTCVSPHAPPKPEKPSSSQDHSASSHTISDTEEKWETSAADYDFSEYQDDLFSSNNHESSDNEQYYLDDYTSSDYDVQSHDEFFQDDKVTQCKKSG